MVSCIFYGYIVIKMVGEVGVFVLSSVTLVWSSVEPGVDGVGCFVLSFIGSWSLWRNSCVQGCQALEM